MQPSTEVTSIQMHVSASKRSGHGVVVVGLCLTVCMLSGIQMAHGAEETASAPVLLELFSKPLGTASLEIPLKELSPRRAEDLAVALLGVETPEADVLAKRIARDSGGNPFFLTELLTSLVENGALERGAEG